MMLTEGRSHLRQMSFPHAPVAAGSAYPRSLQRLLREEGTTFEAIKDETRRDFAQRYLSHPDVPLTQVSALLD